MPNVSVIISTYNRADSLKDTLESLRHQQANGHSFEVIVVDNNSKDHTREVVEHFANVNGCTMKYVFESKQGISYARNTGIREAKGELIAFTDDDVVVDRQWIAFIWDCHRETGALAIAGKIERLWNCERPEWLTEEISGPLIHQDLGIFRKRWDSKNRHMVGANMIFHRSVFEKHGFFCEELGRRGDQLVGGEDREFFQRLWEHQVSIFYEPEAVVAHKVERDRLTKEYMRRWFWEVGKTLGHGIERKASHILTIAPLWLWKDMTVATGRWFKSRLHPLSSDAEQFASDIWVLHHAGILSERLIHWIPFRAGKRRCVFAQDERQRTKDGRQT